MVLGALGGSSVSIGAPVEERGRRVQLTEGAVMPMDVTMA